MFVEAERLGSFTKIRKFLQRVLTKTDNVIIRMLKLAESPRCLGTGPATCVDGPTRPGTMHPYVNLAGPVSARVSRPQRIVTSNAHLAVDSLAVFLTWLWCGMPNHTASIHYKSWKKRSFAIGVRMNGASTTKDDYRACTAPDFDGLIAVTVHAGRRRNRSANRPAGQHANAQLLVSKQKFTNTITWPSTMMPFCNVVQLGRNRVQLHLALQSDLPIILPLTFRRLCTVPSRPSPDASPMCGGSGTAMGDLTLNSLIFNQVC